MLHGAVVRLISAVRILECTEGVTNNLCGAPCSCSFKSILFCFISDTRLSVVGLVVGLSVHYAGFWGLVPLFATLLSSCQTYATCLCFSGFPTCICILFGQKAFDFPYQFPLPFDMPRFSKLRLKKRQQFPLKVLFSLLLAQSVL